jgi:hypothetical protein
MKNFLLVFIMFSFAAEAREIRDSAPITKDEEASQRYEKKLLDGEDREFVEDEITQDGFLIEELELGDVL